MTPSRVSTVCVALWLTGIILSSNLEVSLGDQAVDCCLEVSNKKIPKHIVASYRDQLKEDGCSINAVIFLTRKGRYLCAPSDVTEWVKTLKSEVDKNHHHCQKKNFTGKRCHGLKPK